MKLLEFRNPKLLYFEKLMPPAKYISLPLDTVSMRKLIYHEEPNAVSFYLTPDTALSSWAQQIQLSPGDVVGLVAPYPKQFQKVLNSHGATLRLLPRDPDEIAKIDFSKFKAVMLSNPNLADSFFYPVGIFDNVLNHLKSFKQLEVLCEESLVEFYKHNEFPEPGTAFKNTFNKLSILSGVYSYSGEKLCWLVQPKRESIKQETAIKAIPQCTHALLSLKHSRNLKNFTKRLFIMEFNLKRFASDLRPALLAGAIKISHWPKPRALYVMIDIAPILEKEKCSVETWCKRLEAETGITVDPGSTYGAPTSIRVCLAYGFRHLRKVTTFLSNNLLHRYLGL